MKINNKKIIVSTLALAMGAALAGSISGSVAWYQYSTRATAAMQGVSAGTSRNLKITQTAAAAANKAHADWGWDINLGKHDLKPVSPVVTSGVPGSFKSHGVRQFPFADAEGTEYLHYDLYFQSIDETGNREAVEVYLETFNVTYGGSKKLDEAIRFAISDGTTSLVTSKDAGTTVTQGHLDLNKDTVDDRWIFEADDRTGLVNDSGTWKKVDTVHLAKDELIPADTYYGTYSNYTLSNPIASGTVTAEGGVDYYKIGSAPGENASYNEGDYIIYSSGAASYDTTAWNAMKSTFTNEYTLGSTGSFHFTTLESDASAAHLSIYIWLEGWEEIDGSSIWDSGLVGEQFSIQMRFQTLAEK